MPSLAVGGAKETAHAVYVGTWPSAIRALPLPAAFGRTASSRPDPRQSLFFKHSASHAPYFFTVAGSGTDLPGEPSCTCCGSVHPSTAFGPRLRPPLLCGISAVPTPRQSSFFSAWMRYALFRSALPRNHFLRSGKAWPSGFPSNHISTAFQMVSGQPRVLGLLR
jgi:hypothetical protein